MPIGIKLCYSYAPEPLATSVQTVTVQPPVAATATPSFIPTFYSSTPRPAIIPPVIPQATTFYSATPRTVISQSPTFNAATPKPLEVQLPVYGRQFAYTSDSQAQARISSYLDKHTYKYAFDTDNGIAAAESGNADGDGTRVKGFYEYIGTDGKTFRVDYTADENGFRPVGAHLPV